MKEKREIVREIISERGRGRESIRGMDGEREREYQRKREREREHFLFNCLLTFLFHF
jgi:hypothetical protein